MAEGFEVSYEKIDDILYVGKKGKVKFSVDVSLPSGDLIVDIGFDGYVKGIEIMNASDFFSLKREELAKIKHGKLNIVYGPSYVAVSILLEGLRQPISSSVVVPYSKKLAIAA